MYQVVELQISQVPGMKTSRGPSSQELKRWGVRLVLRHISSLFGAPKNYHRLNRKQDPTLNGLGTHPVQRVRGNLSALTTFSRLAPLKAFLIKIAQVAAVYHDVTWHAVMDQSKLFAPIFVIFVLVKMCFNDISIYFIWCRRTCLSENHQKPNMLEDVTFLPDTIH